MKWDVIVVGVGHAGSIFCHELANAGFNILGLEAGEHYTDHYNEFVENETALDKHAWKNDAYTVTGDGFTGAPNFGYGVGGGSLVWTNVSLRFFEHDFKARSTYGKPDNSSLEDWPISLADLEQYYRIAEKQLGVSGSFTSWETDQYSELPNPAFNYYSSSKALDKGMSDLGLRSESASVAINSQEYKGDSACLHCGFCPSGCRIDARFQADHRLIQPTLKKGLLELRSNVVVNRIDTNIAGDKATGVRYKDANGNEVHVEAKLIIVCNNPMEIPRLFLASANKAHPNGLGNKNDLVGRNFFCHPSTVATGVTDECHMSSIGYNMGNILTLDRVRNKDQVDYVGGFTCLSLNGSGIGVLSADPYRHLWGKALKDALATYNQSLFMIAFCEGMPVHSNRITVDFDAIDKNGLPKAHIHYQLHENDYKVFSKASKQLEEILIKSGSTSVALTASPFEAHPAGTMRMGDDPTKSVTDSYGKIHGMKNLYVAGSALYVTGSSVNPTLTLHALALRSCNKIRQEGIE